MIGNDNNGHQMGNVLFLKSISGCSNTDNKNNKNKKTPANFSTPCRTSVETDFKDAPI